MIRACILKASGLYSIVSNANIINNKQYSQHKLGTDPKCKDAPVYIETIHTDESGKDLSTVNQAVKVTTWIVK